MEEPLQLPCNESALDYIFRTASDDGVPSAPNKRAAWPACGADAESLDDLDYGACIDAVSSRCSTLVGARVAAEVMLRPVSDKGLISARMRDVRTILAASRERPRFARSFVGSNSTANRVPKLGQKSATNAPKGDVKAGTLLGDGNAPFSARDAVEAAVDAESKALWCSLSPDDMDHDAREALGEPYFRGGPQFICKALNSYWPLLYGCGAYNAYAVPAMAMAAPLIYLLTPFFVIRWRMNLPITPGMYARVMYHAMMGTDSTLRFAIGSPMASVLQLASLGATAIMYAQGVASTLRSSARLREVSARISDATHAAHTIVSGAAALSEEALRVCGPGFFDRWLPPELEDHPSATGASEWALKDVPKTAPLWNKDSAVALAAYTRIDRTALRSAFLVLAAVDLVQALGSLLSGAGGDGGSCGGGGRGRAFCQPELVGTGASPLVAIKAGWCPGLGGLGSLGELSDAGSGLSDAGSGLSDAGSGLSDAGSGSALSTGAIGGDGCETARKPVPNDIALAWPIRRGMLVTGANATGKSTALRVLGCCSLMAQTVGVAPAASMALTPLGYVCTMMRVRDSPERGLSRFQAELLRAGHCMDSATEGAARSRGGLVLLDEVFAGSSDSRSSDACGVRVLEVISGSAGALVVLSTHQDSLADWAESRRGFASYMTEPNGYKLVKGRNSTSNAAEQMSRFRRQTQTLPP
jgi:hypothetical protein